MSRPLSFAAPGSLTLQRHPGKARHPAKGLCQRRFYEMEMPDLQEGSRTGRSPVPFLQRAMPDCRLGQLVG
jgi:hypothetical protein